MKNRLRLNLIRFFSLVPLSLAAPSSLACGTGSSATITNLPALPNTGYQVYGLNPTGQLTGYFFDSTHAAHAFFYDSGALTDLGTFGGSSSIGYAINSSGQVCGESYYGGDTTIDAFLYSGGNVLDLGTLGGDYSSASALNHAGQVVGASLPAFASDTHAFLYSSNAMTDLGTLGGDYSSAFAINSSGTIVGESYVASGDTHAFVYASGTMPDLGTLGGNYSSAFGINDSNVLIGVSMNSAGNYHGFAWNGGSLIDLGTLGGSFSTTYAINRSGQIIGLSSTTGDAQYDGYIYSNGVMTDLGTLGGNSSIPIALNNLGQVVGYSTLPDGVTQHAFLWQAGQMVDVNSLVSTNSGWVLMGCQCINDAGRIVGYGTLQGASQWFILDLGAGSNGPVAVAGPDQTVQCDSQVTLDGSASTGDNLSFAWSLAGTILGTTPTVSVSLPLGTNVVTLTVTDACGTSAQTNVTVTVRDTIPPTGSCPGALMASADANCQAPIPNVVPDIIASDNCTPASALVISQNPAAGTLVGLGPHPITVTVSDASGNSSTCTTLFTVNDTTPPVIISVPAPLTVSADANCQGLVPNVLPNVVAMDNCSSLSLAQTPAAGTLLDKGQYSISVVATDAAGNTASTPFVLTLPDTTPPVIQSLTATPNVLSPPNGKLIPVSLSVAAADNCDSAPVSQLVSITCSDPTATANDMQITGPLSAALAAAKAPSGNARVYTLTVQCTDASGNSSTATVLVTVPHSNDANNGKSPNAQKKV